MLFRIDFSRNSVLCTVFFPEKRDIGIQALCAMGGILINLYLENSLKIPGDGYLYMQF